MPPPFLPKLVVLRWVTCGSKKNHSQRLRVPAKKRLASHSWVGHCLRAYFCKEAERGNGNGAAFMEWGGSAGYAHLVVKGWAWALWSASHPREQPIRQEDRGQSYITFMTMLPCPGLLGLGVMQGLREDFCPIPQTMLLGPDLSPSKGRRAFKKCSQRTVWFNCRSSSMGPWVPVMEAKEGWERLDQTQISHMGEGSCSGKAPEGSPITNAHVSKVSQHVDPGHAENPDDQC